MKWEHRLTALIKEVPEGSPALIPHNDTMTGLHPGEGPPLSKLAF